jgi:hypothetical protein
MNNFQSSVNSEMGIPRLKARMASGVTRRVRNDETPRVGSISQEMKMYAGLAGMETARSQDKKPGDNNIRFRMQDTVELAARLRKQPMNNFRRSVNAEMQIPRPRIRMIPGVTRRIRMRESQESETTYGLKMYAELVGNETARNRIKSLFIKHMQFTGLLAYRPLELLYFTFVPA